MVLTYDYDSHKVTIQSQNYEILIGNSYCITTFQDNKHKVKFNKFI